MLSGTPAVGTAGSYSLTFTATNGVGNAATANFTLTVNPASGSIALANGGFEAPVLGSNGYQVQPSGGSWVFGAGAGIQRNGSASGAASAPEGQQTAFLQGGNVQLSQTINLAAGNYSVSFAAARRAYQGAGQPLQLSVDGVAIGTPILPASTAFAVYTSAAFSVAAGNHTLGFTTTNPNNGDNSSFLDAVTLNVLGLQAPTITSANATTFTIGQTGTFNVQTTGVPTPSLSVTGSLPSGVSFVDNGNGTAMLSGTPAVGTAGSYSLTFTATNGVGNAATANFTLTVNPASGTMALANGGFEAPVLGSNGYQVQPSGGSWVFGAGAGIQRNGSAWGAASAPEGQQTAFLQGGNVQLSQTINLAAGNYSVSFAAARRAYQGAGQPLQLSVDGVAIGTPILPASTAFAVYTSAAFSVAAGNHTLGFTTTNPNNGDNSSFLDAVTLNVVGLN